jgi:hypothetical protein
MCGWFRKEVLSAIKFLNYCTQGSFHLLHSDEALGNIRPVI